MFMILRRAALVAVMAAAPFAATAADWALVFGDTGQLPQLRGSQAASSADFTQPLRAAGFQVVEPKNRSAAHMRLAAQLIEQQIAAGQVDRLVIVASGAVAGRSGDSWLMSNDAIGATGLTIGALGMSLNALSDMAALTSGPAVILLAPGDVQADVGTGLSAGLQGYDQANEVTYFSGTGQELAGILAQDLLNADRSYAQIAATVPEGVAVMGNVSRYGGLMTPIGPQQLNSEEDGFWLAVRMLDTKEAYAAYLGEYPGGQYAQLAKNAMVQRTQTPEDIARETENALNLSREARRDVQRNLTVLDIDPGGIDGLFGPGTRAAIAKWQRARGLPETGYLRPKQVTRLASEAAARAQELEAEAAARRAQELARDRAYWAATGEGRDEPGLRTYLEKFPDGEYSDLANERLNTIEEAKRAEADERERDVWDVVKEGHTIQGYQAYLNEYPNGSFAEAANARIARLQERSKIEGAIDAAREEERSVAGNKEIREMIERRLTAMGLEAGPADGKFNKQTRKAIRQFQRGQNLIPTGFVTRQTLARMMVR